MVRAALHKCFFWGLDVGRGLWSRYIFFLTFGLMQTLHKFTCANSWEGLYYQLLDFHKMCTKNIWERSGLWRRNFFSFQTYAIMHKARWANSWELLQNHGSIYYKGAGDLVCNTHNKFKTWTLNSWHLDTACIWAISFSLFLLLQSFEVL